MDKETQACFAEQERQISLLWDRLENVELQLAYMTQDVAPDEEPLPLDDDWDLSDISSDEDVEDV